MTLSQFLRDYLYIPLGGNRRGPVLRYVNLMVTMLLGGLWHGASWTFVVWGALHGAYLCVNHAWNNFGPKTPPRLAPLANVASLVLTFLAVVVAWVFFRADSIASALGVLSRMADPTYVAFGKGELAYAMFIAVYAAIAWFAPNTQAIMGYDHEQRAVGEKLRGVRIGPCSSMPPPPCWRSGFSASSSTANSFISGFDERDRKQSAAFSCRHGGHHRHGGRPELSRRSAAAFPARAPVRRDVFA
jgi:hypothetical protein